MQNLFKKSLALEKLYTIYQSNHPSSEKALILAYNTAKLFLDATDGIKKEVNLINEIKQIQENRVNEVQQSQEKPKCIQFQNIDEVCEQLLYGPVAIFGCFKEKPKLKNKNSFFQWNRFSKQAFIWLSQNQNQLQEIKRTALMFWGLKVQDPETCQQFWDKKVNGFAWDKFIQEPTWRQPILDKTEDFNQKSNKKIKKA